MKPKIILPLYQENSYRSLYGNFGERLAALLLDGLILAPFTITLLLLNAQNINNAYFTTPIALLINIVYHLVTSVHYGATPGKIAMGLFILQKSGGYIGYKEAFLKLLPQLLLSIIPMAINFYAISQIDVETYNSMGWFDQQQYLKTFYPFFGTLLIIVLPNMYSFSNLLFFLLNDRKQSLGDALAGTVVVHKRNLDWIEEFRKKAVEQVES